ncbi:MAG: IS66 family insertion sequence element accessory protein TnpA [Polyangiaceae bacterium]
MGGGRTTRSWQQWTEQDAREALAELATSGESKAQFARRRGVSTERLRYWQKRLASATAPSFIAVPLSASRGQLEIAVGDVTVRVREDIDLARLADLLDLVAGRSREC